MRAIDAIISAWENFCNFFTSRLRSKPRIQSRKVSFNEYLDFDREELNETGHRLQELEFYRKKLDEIRHRLHETEQRLAFYKNQISIANENNKLLSLKNTELKYAMDSRDKLIFELKKELEIKEEEIQRLQLKQNFIDNLLKEEHTKKIGKFDAWSQEKFEILQANTQQQFIEYHKMLAYYQNELDKLNEHKHETVAKPLVKFVKEREGDLLFKETLEENAYYKLFDIKGTKASFQFCGNDEIAIANYDGILKDVFDDEMTYSSRAKQIKNVSSGTVEQQPDGKWKIITLAKINFI